MWFRRAIRGVVGLLGGCLPTASFWLLIVATLHRRDAAGTTTPSPNPTKLPAWRLGPLDVVVYADPYLAGTLTLWLLPGVALLIGVGLWGAGVPMLSKERPACWPVPRLLKVVWVSLAVGSFLALPWFYAWIRVLCEPVL